LAKTTNSSAVGAAMKINWLVLAHLTGFLGKTATGGSLNSGTSQAE
jgi:hypothetical protein